MDILYRHRRLRKIGQALLQGELIPDEDRVFLGNALTHIGCGADARDELQTKPQQGEDSFKTVWEREVRDRHMYGLLEAAMASEEEGGLGLTKKEAIKWLKNTEAGKIYFAISEETIDRYLRKYPEKRKRTYTLD